MRLLSNWKEILQRAWSIRLMLLAGLLSGIEVALPFFDGYVDVPIGIFALASAIVTFAAFIARLFAQTNLEGKINATTDQE